MLSLCHSSASSTPKNKSIIGWEGDEVDGDAVDDAWSTNP